MSRPPEPRCSATKVPTQEMRDKLIEHKQYITRYGDDMPEVKQWRWSEATGV
jgi:phosphoketolase